MTRPGLTATGRASIERRIGERVEHTPDGCWSWTGTLDKNGYAIGMCGSRTDGTRGTRRLARVAYELWVGPLAPELTVDHLCNNRACLNPVHLEAVAQAENKRRAALRRTTCRRGHPRTPENTRIKPCDGRITCLVCEAARDRRRAA